MSTTQRLTAVTRQSRRSMCGGNGAARDCATLLREFSRRRLEIDLLHEYGPDAQRLAGLVRRLIGREANRVSPSIGRARRRLS
jgi:hypothetical protein